MAFFSNLGLHMTSPFLTSLNYLESSLFPPNCVKKHSVPYKLFHLTIQCSRFHFWAFLSLHSAPFALAGKTFQKISPQFGYHPIKDEDEEFVKHPTWEKLDEEGNIPLEKFLNHDLKHFGVASADYQDNGENNFPNSSWANWERKQVFPYQGLITFFHLEKFVQKMDHILARVFHKSRPFSLNSEKESKKSTSQSSEGWITKISNVEKRSGFSLDYWNHLDLLMEDLKKVGVRDYRLSLDRSALEPKEGEYNQEAITHYKNLFQRLFNEGIEPNVTLHHFNDPEWFMEKGGWENQNNIPSYLNFIKAVMPQIFTTYQVTGQDQEGNTKQVDKKIHYCATFNESAAFSFESSVLGDFPPGKILNFQAQALTLKNMLNAHDQIYDALKNIDKDLQVGITHNFLRLNPYHSYNPIARAISHYFSHILHGVVMKYFKEQKFTFQVPFFANLKEKRKIQKELPEAKLNKKLDWFGVQYYSEPLLSLTKGSTCFPGEKMVGSMPYRFYPQGLLHAIKEAGELDVPLMVTESGISDYADKSHESMGSEHMQKIFQVLKKAQGRFNLIGFYQWCLRTNYEWGRKVPDFGVLDSEGNLKSYGELFRQYSEKLFLNMSKP